MSNISNIDTNIFDTTTGMLNLAPIKISGKYKLVFTGNGVLWFDDYSGNRKVVDLTQKFLPQLASFLSNNSKLSDNESLQFGGFQKQSTKAWHIPLYVNNNYPKYFVLSKVNNSNLDLETDLYKFGKILSVIDLEKIGLFKIFDEINQSFKYPVYFDLENNSYELNGYSIKDKSIVTNKYSLQNNRANQPYLELLNNQILNNYSNGNIVFPKFINLEFEFDYSNEITHFNNFYGFVADGTLLASDTDMSENKLTIKLQDFSDTNLFIPSTNKIIWKQIYKGYDIELVEYLDVIKSGSIYKLPETLPQLNFHVNNIMVDDSITIKHPDDSIIFEYVIKQSDIDITSIIRTWQNICNNATTQSRKDFIFSTKTLSSNGLVINIVANIVDTFINEYYIELPWYCRILERFQDINKNKFRGIESTDIWLMGQKTLLNDANSLYIDRLNYGIIEQFEFNDKLIIRLDTTINFDSTKECIIQNVETEKIIEFNRLPFLTYNSTLASIPKVNKALYCAELKTNFPDYITTIEEFESRKYESLNQYLFDDIVNSELDNVSEVIGEDYNQEQIKNILFCNGSTTFITPNILNIDKRFNTINGNIDINLFENDLYRYDWFLIKGICPEYLKGTINELRYFTDTPVLTSLLDDISTEYCETIFLGVKYKFPVKYSGYKFAVYLNFNDTLNISLTYDCQINIEEKTIYLAVNKYLDFIDLIRGGDTVNDPLLDLSLFYSIDNSFNANSDYFNDFKSAILRLSDPFKISEPSIYFNNTELRDWKYFDGTKWYIALRRIISSSDLFVNDLRLLFPETGNSTFYVYSSIQYNGETYNYVAISCELINIHSVAEGYIWCEDVRFKFFDTEKIFLTKYNEVSKLNELIYINKSETLSNLLPKSDEIFGDYIKTTTILVNGENVGIELILPDTILSLKENYFDITYNSDNLLQPKIVFKFPEYGLDAIDQELINRFLPEIDSTINGYTVSIFNRNQIWRLVQDLFKNSLKFKYLSKSAVRNIMNKFTVSNMIDYLNQNSLVITNATFETDSYIKILIEEIKTNTVIWQLNNKPSVVEINRFKTIYKPFMPIIDVFDFQLSKNNKNNRLFNIYDIYFDGVNSATGLWSEVKGNVVSSLFCKTEDIIITLPFGMEFNIIDILQNYFNIDDCIINHNNQDYIKKINENVDTYIIETYINYLLLNFYKLDSVKTENNVNLTYTILDGKTIKFNDKNYYSINFNNLMFIFKRK